MRKGLAFLLSLALLLTMIPVGLALPVNAAISGDYEYTISGGKATITYYAGDNKTVSIPKTLDGYPVTAIGNNAFEWALSLTTLTIGNNVTTIGNRAFANCTALKTVTIGAGITSIGNQAFANCSALTGFTVSSSNPQYATVNGVLYNKSKTKLLQYPLGNTATSYALPDSVTSIALGALTYCKNLEAITVSNKNTHFSAVEGVLFSKDKTKLVQYPIGNGSWEYTILKTVTTIGEYAFAGNSALGSITLSNALASIENGAFELCSSLNAIAFPYSLTDIGDDAFSNCYGLTTLFIPNSVNTVGDGAFGWCDGLVSVTIGNGVNAVGDSAFYGCSSLASVSLSDSIAVLNDYVFFGCSSLTKVTIPIRVTAIGEYAFGDCANLAAVTIGESLTSVGEMAFDNCSRLKEVWYAGSKVSREAISIGSDNTAFTKATWHYAKSIYLIAQSKTNYTPLGKEAVATVTAAGDGLRYQWYFRDPGHSKYYKSSITSAKYSVKMSASSKDRLVYCVITDKYGNTVKTEAVRLRMAATIAATSATATYTQMGKETSAKVTAVGDGLTYTWYIKNEGQNKYYKSSVKTATYVATMSGSVKNRKLYCVVKDKYGNTTTSKVFLFREAVSIKKQPQSVTVKKNAIARVTVKASGDGLRYVWYVKSAKQSSYTMSSVTSATYSCKMSSASHNRKLICYVYDKYGNQVHTQTVIIKMK